MRTTCQCAKMLIFVYKRYHHPVRHEDYVMESISLGPTYLAAIISCPTYCRSFVFSSAIILIIFANLRILPDIQYVTVSLEASPTCLVTPLVSTCLT